MILIDQIRDLISEGETEKSLEELYTYVKENNADIIDNLVMLKGRMRNLQRAVQNGTMDDQDASFERAKINEAILKLLPQLTPEYLAEASKRQELHRAPPAAAAAAPPAASRQARPAAAQAQPAKSNFKPYLIGGGATLLLLMLIGLCNQQDTSSIPVVMEQQQAPQESAPVTQYTNAAPSNSKQTGSRQSGDQQQSNSNEAAPVATQNTLIDRVLAAHGAAAWQTNDERRTFVVDTKNGTCEEVGADGSVCCHFEVTGSDETYLALYDANRTMNLLLSEDQALIRHDNQTSWRVLYKGGWITRN